MRIKKNFVKKVILRKKTLLTVGAMAAVAIIGGTVLMNATRSAFDIKAPSEMDMQVGNFELTVTPLDLTDYDPYDYEFDAATFDVAINATIDDNKAKNTTENSGETAFYTFEDIITAPGYNHVVGYKLENTGNLEHMNVSLELMSNHAVVPEGADPAKFQVDPRSRITYTVYKADETGKNFTDVTEEVADGTADLLDVTTMTNVTSQYIDLGVNKVAYYVIVFNFTDDGSVPTNNWEGDNSFKDARVTCDIKIRAQQPISTTN